jgi:NifU-like protein
MWDYTDKVWDHFKNPRNVGDMPDADAVGMVGNIVCGDALRLMLKVDKATEKIIDAKFQTFGCASAIASSSVLAELVKGKTLDEALSITNKDIAEKLGGLPAEKMHCSVMGMEALESAVRDYKEKNGQAVPRKDPALRIVCNCFDINEGKLLRAIKDNGLKTVEEVTHFTKAGGACGQCKGEIRKILDSVNGACGESCSCRKPFAELTSVQKVHIVERMIAEEIAPRLVADGGSVELVDVEGTNIKVRFLGMCGTCPNAEITMKSFVEKTLQDKVDPAITVSREL